MYSIDANIFFPEQYDVTVDKTNTHDTVQKMFDAIPDGATLSFANGTYIIDASKTYVVNKNIRIQGNIKSKIVLTNQVDNIEVFKIGGAVGSRYSITENYNFYDHQLSGLPAEILTGLKHGDLLLISTAPKYGGDGTEFDGGQGNNKGEIIEVNFVRDSILNTIAPLKDSYCIGATISKIDYKTVVIDGLNIESSSDYLHTVIHVGFTKNAVINNVEITGSGVDAFNLNGAYKFTVTNFRASDITYHQDENNGLSYGLKLTGCQDGTVSQCKIFGGRHALEISGGDFGTTFPSRYVLVSNNILGFTPNVRQLAFSTHPCAEHITFTGNIVNGGMKTRNINNRITNNKIIETCTIMWSGKCDYFIFENNHLDLSMKPNIIPIIVCPSVFAEYSTNMISVCNNTIKSSSANLKINSFDETQVGCNKINQLNICDNKFYTIQVRGYKANEYSCHVIDISAYKCDIDQFNITGNKGYVQKDEALTSEYCPIFKYGNVSEFNFTNNALKGREHNSIINDTFIIK